MAAPSQRGCGHQRVPPPAALSRAGHTAAPRADSCWRAYSTVVARLSQPLQRTALRLSIMRTVRSRPSLTAEQIATLVGCHPSTVRKHLSACRRHWTVVGAADRPTRQAAACAIPGEVHTPDSTTCHPSATNNTTNPRPKPHNHPVTTKPGQLQTPANATALLRRTNPPRGPNPASSGCG